MNSVGAIGGMITVEYSSGALLTNRVNLNPNMEKFHAQ